VLSWPPEIRDALEISGRRPAPSRDVVWHGRRVTDLGDVVDLFTRTAANGLHVEHITISADAHERAARNVS
jgi:hypothetical protein